MAEPLNCASAARRCPICGGAGAPELLQAPDRFHGRAALYRLVRCPSCTLVWLDQPPQPAEMWRHYGADYDAAIAQAAETSPDRWTGRRETVLRYASGGAILDLGCSSGSFLAGFMGGPWKLYGIEMSPQMAKLAQDKCGAQVFVGDILAAPFEPNSFDVITCFHVFEHLYEPKAVLARIAEWLRPGGVFYGVMPNIDSACARLFKSYWYPLELPRHLFHFSPASLLTLAASVDLQVAEVRTYRESYVEHSARYVCDALLGKVGVHRAPVAQARRARLPWKIVRKGLRLSLLPLFAATLSLVGDEEALYAIFRKP